MWSNETEAGYIIYRESNVWFDDLLFYFFSETTFFFWDKAGIIKNFIILITNMWIFYKKNMLPLTYVHVSLCVSSLIILTLPQHTAFTFSTPTHRLYIKDGYLLSNLMSLAAWMSKLFGSCDIAEG